MLVVKFEPGRKMSIFNVWLRALYEYLTHNASILREAAKKSFFLVAMPSPPPLLVAGPLKKYIFYGFH